MKPQLIIAPIVLATVLSVGYWIDKNREAKQSVLSGFFENQPTEASSRLGGRVSRILVREGQEVKKGQPMVVLEDASYQATSEAAQKQAQQAEERYKEQLNGPREEDIHQQEWVVREAEATYEKITRGPRGEEIAAQRHRLQQAQAQLQKLRNGSRPEEISAAQNAANAAVAAVRLAEKGATDEEIAQLQARLDSAQADEALAKKQLDRTTYLVTEGAVARQQLDIATATHQQAIAHRKDAEQALKRAKEGTRPEELARLRAIHRQTVAQLDLVKRGARREDVEAARQETLAAQANLNLLTNGSRQEDIEAARAKLEQAKAALEELRKGTRPEQIAQAKAAAEAATLQAKSTTKNLQERTVYAPADGLVDRVMVADGDVVQAGTPVIQMSVPGDIWLRVYLPEAQLAKVKVGDQADLIIDGIGQTVNGKVQSIAARGEFTPANLQSPEERAKQVFAIRIGLAQPNPQIKAGMYATVKKVGQWP